MNKNYPKKVNLHVLEACNYYCKHCFSYFNAKTANLNEWKIIVDNFNETMGVSYFNIAGGEPMLYDDLIALSEYINEKNCKCSIITNGSLMDLEWIEKYAHLYSMIGFSIDSFFKESLVKIGRCDILGQVLSFEDLKLKINKIREINPKCKIKVNTVVTSLNKDEVLVDKIKDLNIDRWKVLKMRIFENKCFSNRNIAVSFDEYQRFLDRNLYCQRVEEFTTEGSYLIVAPDGSLLDNQNTTEHNIVGNCIYEPANKLYDKLDFCLEIYNMRYQNNKSRILLV